MTKKHYSPYNFKNHLDSLIFFVFLLYIVITFGVNWRGAAISEGTTFVPWDEKAAIFCKNYVSNGIDEETLVIVGVMLLWVRVMNFMRYLEELGKFVSVVRKLIPEIFLFFMMYIVNLFFFSTIAVAAFRDLKEYNTLWEAFKTLFYASFGTFDYDILEGNTTMGKNFGITFMSIFLTINIGLFMSVFVAIITVLFAKYQKHDRIYQMIETLKMRATTQADKKYSLLVSVPVPFNILLLFLGPCLITSKRAAQLN